MQFKKATKEQVKLKLGMQGPAGSGKTEGALALATRIAVAEGGRVAVIDSENGSASLYADRYDFDTLTLGAPFTSARYMEAIDTAVAAGFKVVIIDSLSHQWAGDGGILSRKEAKDARGNSNSYTNWAAFTKEHEAFKAALLAAPVHIISTLRTKTEYVLTENARGKQEPKKLGTAPIQRDGMEYEFSVMWELQMDHMAASSKDRTSLFDGRLVDLTKAETAAELLRWLKSGAELAPKEAPAASEPEMGLMDKLVTELLSIVDDANNGITNEEREKVEEWLKEDKILGPADIEKAIKNLRAKIERRASKTADGAAAAA